MAEARTAWHAELAWLGEPRERVLIEVEGDHIAAVTAGADAPERAIKLAGFDLIELNEAFAAQVLACDRELHLDRDKLNVNGGAIALGHPIGCTGTRITVTLLHEMLKRKARRGVATLCVSGGMGMALALENVA